MSISHKNQGLLILLFLLSNVNIISREAVKRPVISGPQVAQQQVDSNDPKMALRFLTSAHNLNFGKESLIKSDLNEIEYVQWLNALTSYLKEVDENSRNSIVQQSNVLKKSINSLAKMYREPQHNYIQNVASIIQNIDNSIAILEGLKQKQQNKIILTASEYVIPSLEKLKKEAKIFKKEMEARINFYDSENIFVSTFSDKTFQDRNNEIIKLVKNLNKKNGIEVEGVLVQANATLQANLQQLKSQFNSWFQNGVIQIPQPRPDGAIQSLQTVRATAREMQSKLEKIAPLTQKNLNVIRIQLQNLFKRIEKDIDTLLIFIRMQ